jgi:predicted DNA-binding transcriptional regulator AlpA
MKKQENNDMAQQYEERLIKLPEVLATLGMKRTAWYAGIRAGKYPKPIKRSPRDTVWPMSAIQKIVSDTIASGGGQAV